MSLPRALVSRDTTGPFIGALTRQLNRTVNARVVDIPLDVQIDVHSDSNEPAFLPVFALIRSHAHGHRINSLVFRGMMTKVDTFARFFWYPGYIPEDADFIELPKLTEFRMLFLDGEAGEREKHRLGVDKGKCIDSVSYSDICDRFIHPGMRTATTLDLEFTPTVLNPMFSSYFLVPGSSILTTVSFPSLRELRICRIHETAFGYLVRYILSTSSIEHLQFGYEKHPFPYPSWNSAAYIAHHWGWIEKEEDFSPSVLPKLQSFRIITEGIYTTTSLQVFAVPVLKELHVHSLDVRAITSCAELVARCTQVPPKGETSSFDRENELVLRVDNLSSSDFQALTSMIEANDVWGRRRVRMEFPEASGGNLVDGIIQDQDSASISAP